MRISAILLCNIFLTATCLDLLKPTRQSNGKQASPHALPSPGQSFNELSNARNALRWHADSDVSSTNYSPNVDSRANLYRENSHLQHSLRLNKRGFSKHVNTKDLFSQRQLLAIRVCAVTLSAISLCGSTLTFYWFFRMRKKFRHKLIIILVTADVIRSLWLFIYPLVTLVRREPISNASALCQATGYFTQLGIELADFAILCIAIHTALQVFHPTITAGGVRESGLYRYRYLIYILAFIIPAVLCSLPYVRGSIGYMSAGPTCALPLRPFWYRLAISWIPRYLIMLTIAGLYCAIYIYVKVKLNSVKLWHRRHSDKTTIVSSGTPSFVTRQQPLDGAGGGWTFAKGRSKRARPAEPEDVAPDEQAIATEQPLAFEKGDAVRKKPVSKKAVDWQGSLDSSNHNDEENPQGGDATKDKGPDWTSKRMMMKAMKKREQEIQRQLRLLFVYPLCYFAIWLLPFVNHACNYSNYLVQHPIFPLTLLSVISLSSMGAVDSLIFSLREKPWKDIRSSDGTFLGSFCFWRDHRSGGDLDSLWGGSSQGRRSSNTLSSPFDRKDSVLSAGPGSVRHGDMDTTSPRRASYLSAVSDSQRMPAADDLGGQQGEDATGRRFSTLAASIRSANLPSVAEDRELDLIDRHLSAALSRRDTS